MGHGTLKNEALRVEIGCRPEIVLVKASEREMEIKFGFERWLGEERHP